MPGCKPVLDEGLSLHRQSGQVAVSEGLMKSRVVCLAFALVLAARATPVREAGSPEPIPGSALCIAGQPCDHTAVPVFIDLGGRLTWLREPTGRADTALLAGLIGGFAAGDTVQNATEQDGGFSPRQLGTEVGVLLLERASSKAILARPGEEVSEGFSTIAMIAAGLAVLGLAWFRRVGTLAC